MLQGEVPPKSQEKKMLGKIILDDEVIWQYGPIRVVHAHDKDTDYLVKIFNAKGVPKKYCDKFNIDTEFFKGCRDMRLTQVVDVVIEPPLTYIIYEEPPGGDLETLLSTNGETFSESFVRNVAFNMLHSLEFLHLNDIVHGACNFKNIVFMMNSAIPGWLEHIQLSNIFCGVTADDNDYSYDLKDLAYVLCALVKRNVKEFLREDFNPMVLKGSKWSHVGPDFVDFIEQLWLSTDKPLSEFLEHSWMETVQPLQLLDNVIQMDEEQEEEPFAPKECWLKFKLNTPKGLTGGNRKWVKAYGNVTAATVSLSGDEEGLTGPEGFALPLAWNLRHIEVVVTLTKYALTFALQNKLTKALICWLRFEVSLDHDEFKAAITDITDPNKAARVVRKVERQSKAKKVKKKEQPVRGKSYKGPIEETDEQRIKRLSALIKAQSIAYCRKTQTRLEHSLEVSKKAGSLAPFPSDARTRIHPGQKWDKRSREVLRQVTVNF
jgi:hypothetical protein